MMTSPGYFEVLRMPILRGRQLSDQDRSEDLIAVVINAAAARHYWPGKDAIDAQGRFRGPDGSRFQVVGIVGDVKNDGLGKPTVAEIYLPSAVTRVETMNVVMRSSVPPATLVSAARQAVRGVDPEQPIHDVALLSDIVRRSMTLERVASYLTTFFAATAVLMASLGIYGVLSYFVRQRTVEIGAPAHRRDQPRHPDAHRRWRPEDRLAVSSPPRSPSRSFCSAAAQWWRAVSNACSGPSRASGQRGSLPSASEHRPSSFLGWRMRLRFKIASRKPCPAFPV